MWLGVSHPISISQGHAHVALAWIWCFCRVICLFPQALAQQKGSCALQLAWANNRRDSWIEVPPLLCPPDGLLFFMHTKRLVLWRWSLRNVKVARRGNCSSQQEAGKWFPWGGISRGSSWSLLSHLYPLDYQLPQPPTYRPKPTRLPLLGHWVARCCLNGISAGASEYLIGNQQDVRFYAPTTGLDPSQQTQAARCYSDLKWIFRIQNSKAMVSWMPLTRAWTFHSLFSRRATPTLGCTDSDPVHCISHSGFTNAAAAKPPAFALNQRSSEPSRVCGRACSTSTAVFYHERNRKCSSLPNPVGERPFGSSFLINHVRF